MTIPFTYPGSGVRWTNHLKQHGNDVKTEVVGKWNNEDIEKCSKFAVRFSEENDIVKSTQWANLIPENGMVGGAIHTSPHSKETKDKIGLANKGRLAGDKNPRFGIRLIGEDNPFYGKTHSEETKKAISDANKGRLVGDSNPSKRPEVRENISFKMKGNQNKKGKTVSEEGRIRISDGHKGLKLSDECKKKISQKKKSTITVLDKDNEVWVNIPTEEYYSNRNRFFAINSKIAKDFKAAHSRK